MGIEQNRNLVQRFYEEVINHRGLDIAGEVMDEGFVDQLGGREDMSTRGLDAFRQFARGLVAAFPDIRVDVEEIVCEGDTVATRVKVSGTHEGPFMELPATRRRVIFTGADFWRIRNGKIAERWACRDIFGLMQQIGGVSGP